MQEVEYKKQKFKKKKKTIKKNMIKEAMRLDFTFRTISGFIENESYFSNHISLFTTLMDVKHDHFLFLFHSLKLNELGA